MPSLEARKQAADAVGANDLALCPPALLNACTQPENPEPAPASAYSIRERFAESPLFHPVRNPLDEVEPAVLAATSAAYYPSGMAPMPPMPPSLPHVLGGGPRYASNPPIAVAVVVGEAHPTTMPGATLRGGNAPAASHVHAAAAVVDPHAAHGEGGANGVIGGAAVADGGHPLFKASSSNSHDRSTYVKAELRATAHGDIGGGGTGGGGQAFRPSHSSSPMLSEMPTLPEEVLSMRGDTIMSASNSSSMSLSALHSRGMAPMTEFGASSASPFSLVTGAPAPASALSLARAPSIAGGTAPPTSGAGSALSPITTSISPVGAGGGLSSNGVAAGSGADTSVHGSSHTESPDISMYTGRASQHP